MITFNTLIKIAPFDENTRQKISMQKESLSPDQERILIQLAWEMIAIRYQAKLNNEIETTLSNMQDGKEEYFKEKFQKIEDELLQGLAKQLESAETSEEIAEVKQQLVEHTKPIT